MTLPVTLFCVFLEVIYMFALMKSFLGKSLKPEKVDIILLIIEFIILPIPETYTVPALFLAQFMYAVYFWLQTGKRVLHTVFLLSTIMIFLHSIQAISSLLLFPVMHFMSIDYLPVIGSIATLALVIVIIRFFRCFDLYQRIITGNFPLKFLVLNSYLVSLLITLFYKTHMKDVYEYIVLIFGTLLVMVFVNFSIFYYENQLKEKQKELLAYEKNKPIFETLIEDIRSNQHEYDNRIQSIAALPDVCRDYETLRNALRKYTASYNERQKYYPLLALNMPLIASTLYNLNSLAEKKHVDMYFQIPNPELNCRVSEHILVDFLHILTQNAIEATEQGKSIYLTLLNQDEDGAFLFEVQNPVSRFYSKEEISRFFQKGFSTKKNLAYDNPDITMPRGYGLYELLTQANKLKGTVSADCILENDVYWMIFTLSL